MVMLRGALLTRGLRLLRRWAIGFDKGWGSGRRLFKLGNPRQGRGELFLQLGNLQMQIRILSAEALNFCVKRHTRSIP